MTPASEGREVEPGRRERRRRSRAARPGVAEATAEPVESGHRPLPAPPAEPTRVAPRARRDPTERQWRELTGSGHTQLSRGVTVRVREADQPTEAELAAAEVAVEIRRRNWTPPD